MERLTTDKLLPPHDVPGVVTLPRTGRIKIGHLNVRSYLAKLEDVIADTSIAHTGIMCFTETFLKPHQNVSGPVLNGESSVVYRFDRPTTNTQDLSNGGVMITCASSLQSQCINIHTLPHWKYQEFYLVHTSTSVCVSLLSTGDHNFP